MLRRPESSGPLMVGGRGTVRHFSPMRWNPRELSPEEMDHGRYEGVPRAVLAFRLALAERRARRWRAGFWIVWACWILSALLRWLGVL